MIRVLRKAVLARDSSSPGYIADIEAAAVSSDETHYVVPPEKFQAIVAKHLRRKPPQAEPPARKPIALGDAVESMLTRLGITKERVQAWTRTKDCGCAARQKWLNQWGYKKQAQVERIMKKAAKWYGIG